MSITTSLESAATADSAGLQAAHSTQSGRKRKRRVQLTIAVKKEIVQRVDGGAVRAVLAREYGVTPAAVTYLMAQRASILCCAVADAKAIRTAEFALVDDALHLWYKRMRAANIPLSNSILQEQALHFKRMFLQQLPATDSRRERMETFNASDGWLARWRARHPGVERITLHGEAASADRNTVEAARLAFLHSLNCEPKDLYNCDETGLFYKLLPNQTLGSKGEKGMKKIKDRLTALLCCNADGSDKCKLLLIGKSEKPRALKGLNFGNLPCEYTHTSKAWMTEDVMMAWLARWNAKLNAERRRIHLLLDNASSHDVDSTQLSNIKLHFLPPNMTAHIQPLDQGIIRAFKAHYKSRLVRKLISGIELNNSLPVITVRDAIEMAAAAWNIVTPETISNCWRHCGIYREGAAAEASSAAMLSIDAALDEVQLAINTLTAAMRDGSCSAAAEYVDAEAAEPIEQEMKEIDIVDRLLMSDAEKKAADSHSDAAEEDDLEHLPPPRVSCSDAIGAAATLRLFLQQSFLDTNPLINQLNGIVDFIEKQGMERLVQRDLSYFFSRQQPL